MMHARHAADAGGGGDNGRTAPQSQRVRPHRSSSLTRSKPTIKNEQLESLHSEHTRDTHKRANGSESHKSHNSHTSRTTQNESGHGSQGFHGSQNFHGSNQFNHSVQQFHQSHTSFFSSSSVNSRQNPSSPGDHLPPPTPSSGQRSNRRKMVPGTPQRRSVTKSSNRSNPQTPSANSMKKPPRKKVGDDSHGATERSSGTRTSFMTHGSMNGSSHRRSMNGEHSHYSSDDGEMDGMRPRATPGKKRRPKVMGDAGSASMSRNSPNAGSRNSPRVVSSQYGAAEGSRTPGSPGKANGRRVVKKREPRRPGDPSSPRRSTSGDNFRDDIGALSTDDDEYPTTPRHPPKRRPKKKGVSPRQGSRAQYSFDEIPETPVAQRSVPSHIGRTPVRNASLMSSSDDEFRMPPTRRTSYENMFTESQTFQQSPSTTKLYEHARRCQWDEVMHEVELNPRDAKTVGDKDGTTALHLAVMSRTNPMMRDGRVGDFKPAPLELIELLVKACPEAASTRCTRKRYTPLAYACLVADHGYDMDDCSEMVLILLKFAPGSVYVFTDDGFSAVDIHILSYSQIHKEKAEVYSGGRTSTVVLRTLLAEQPDLAESRVYKHKVRGPIELLYRCNTSEFQDAMIDDLTGEANDVKKKQLKSRFGSVASVLSDWWAWKWVLLLLKFSTIKDKKPGTIFSAVQAAARLVACPLPILALAINTFPHQVEERDPRGELYNLPLHEVCSWRADEAIISGDPFVAGRKLKAIQLLLNEYPEASRMTNNMGETPLQLAVESCTAWHGGLELLVESCPKALKFPRKLRMGDQGLCLSVLNPSALDSVASFDSEEEDPMAAMEGMYPFALAAVLGGVATNKRRIPLDFTEEQKAQHIQQLAQKDLQAVRTVFGLLRSRPDVLEKYRKDVTKDYLRMLKAMEND